MTCIDCKHDIWPGCCKELAKKNVGRDPKGNIIILPPVSAEEQIAVQRETKARTLLLQSLPEDHMADFHHLDDARDIWLAVKARFECTGKQVESNARYSAFKIKELKQDKPADPKALLSVVLQDKLDNTLARFAKWKESSKNLAKLVDSSMTIIISFLLLIQLVPIMLALPYRLYQDDHDLQNREVERLHHRLCPLLEFQAFCSLELLDVSSALLLPMLDHLKEL
ncbi:hypothetical protein Tco_0826403 [Tanacetum coccineum]